jgi:hypothetical protein
MRPGHSIAADVCAANDNTKFNIGITSLIPDGILSLESEIHKSPG